MREDTLALSEAISRSCGSSAKRWEAVIEGRNSLVALPHLLSAR